METLEPFLKLQHPIWQGLLLAMLLGITLYFCWSPISQVFAYLRLQRMIRAIGQHNLKTVYLPDGMDGTIYIEHLILHNNGLLLLQIKPYRGNIFAAEKIEQWTQVLGNHSYKFSNPWFQLEADLQCLRGEFPEVDIKGLVVFTRDCNFPKGKPEFVYDLQQLSELRQSGDQRPPTELLLEIWKSICEKSVRAKHLQRSVIYTRADKMRLLFGIGCLLLSLIYFSWYMGWLGMVL